MKKLIPLFTILTFVPLFALVYLHLTTQQHGTAPSRVIQSTLDNQVIENKDAKNKEMDNVQIKDIAQLTALTLNTPKDSAFVYPIKMTQMGNVATIYPSAELKVDNANDVQVNNREVTLSGYQMEGAESVIYQAVGQRSIIAVVTESGQQQLKKGKAITDDYDNLWHQVTLSGSIDAAVLPTRTPIWNYANHLDSVYCGTCHSKKNAQDLTVNSWGPVVKSMAQRTNISKDNLNILTKFFEFNAKDAAVTLEAKEK